MLTGPEKALEGLGKSKIGEYISGPSEMAITRMGIVYPKDFTVPPRPLNVRAAEELEQAPPLRLPLILPTMMRIVVEDGAREEAPVGRLQVLGIQEEAEVDLEEEALAATVALREEEVVEGVRVVPVDHVAASTR